MLPSTFGVLRQGKGEPGGGGGAGRGLRGRALPGKRFDTAARDCAGTPLLRADSTVPFRVSAWIGRDSVIGGTRRRSLYTSLDVIMPVHQGGLRSVMSERRR